MSRRPPTGFFLHPSAALHDTGWGHPEHQGRLRALASSVGRDMLLLHDRVEQVDAAPCARDDLLRVHTEAHLAGLEARVEEARRTGSVQSLEDGETRVSAASWDAVTGSTGALLSAVGAVARGELANAFVANRPPGHHASASRAMGFCLVNPVATAARWLQDEGHAERVLVVDWDVHHGNGTQEIFYADPSVYYLSLHQAPLWPGTGGADETGEGEAAGTTLNVPLPPGTSRLRYLERFDRALTQATSAFRPDFILVSAGFDTLASDPLGGMLLEPPDFHVLASRVVALAEEQCAGRVVAALEGGYEPRGTGLAVVEVIRAFAGVDPGEAASGSVGRTPSSRSFKESR